MSIIMLPTRPPTQDEIKAAFISIINSGLKKKSAAHTFGMYLATICSLEQFFGESLVYRVPRFPETRREPKAILFDIGMEIIFTHEEKILRGGVTFILDYFFSEFEKCGLDVRMMTVDFDRIKNLARAKD